MVFGDEVEDVNTREETNTYFLPKNWNFILGDSTDFERLL